MSSWRRSAAATSRTQPWSRPWCGGGAETWEAVTSFYKAVMLAKEEAEREQEILQSQSYAPDAAERDSLGVRDWFWSPPGER